MIELHRVVDREGKPLKGQGRKAKHFYLRKADAQGVATQYNNVQLCQQGIDRQLDGAPFRVQSFIAEEVA